MGYIFRLTCLFLVLCAATPALADSDDEALADQLAAKMAEDLYGEDYTVVKECDGRECVITLTRE